MTKLSNLQFHNHEITRGNITHLWAVAACVITSSAIVTRTLRLKVLVINIVNTSPEEEGGASQLLIAGRFSLKTSLHDFRIFIHLSCTKSPPF